MQSQPLKIVNDSGEIGMLNPNQFYIKKSMTAKVLIPGKDIKLLNDLITNRVY